MDKREIIGMFVFLGIIYFMILIYKSHAGTPTDRRIICYPIDPKKNDSVAKDQ